MHKILLKFFSFLIILSILFLVYLSFFGIETTRFNKLIKDEISKSSQKVNVKFDKVKILLNLTTFSINLKASNLDLLFDNKKIEIKDIATNFSLKSFILREFAIKNVSISTKDNKLKDVVNFLRVYKNTPQLIILDKMLSRGSINTNIEIYFSDDGKVNENFKVQGIIENAEIRLFNKDLLSNIDLIFDIQEKLYLFENTKVEYKGIKFLAPNIKITDNENSFFVEGNVNNETSEFDNKKLSKFIKNGFENLNFKNLKLDTKNKFSFKINKKFKISDFLIKSKINLENGNFKIDDSNLKNYLPKYNGSINLEDHKIELAIKGNKISLIGNGNYLVDKEIEKINYNISGSSGNYNFTSKINLNKNSLNLELLNYKKEENKDSTLSIYGNYKKNKGLFFKKIKLEELQNKFLIEDLSLAKDFKINHIGLIDLDFVNNNKKINKIILKRDKKNYIIKSKIFDGSKLLDEILNSEDDDGISRIFSNLSANIKINVDKIFIGDEDFLKNLKSNLNIKKSILKNLDLSANFFDNRKISLTIRSNQNNEKITTLFSENAKPLVKKYKFIKGFEEGSLDFYSLKKNNLSKSKLKINNFKLKELPALTKILTLASLQGIADLLTGEGIRFDEFEMDFHSKKKLMTINEIYAIGPAISLMMEGYVQGKDLVSLRGTLVPATTINKFVGSIPILGKILVGKKTGEGVFGVSFKIKGPPKDLKTTVNPIKTLTPRFITRTLEKIKKDGVEVKSP